MASPSSRRCARILAGVREDVDRFLDPSVLSLVAQEAALGPSAAAAASSPADAAAGAAAAAAGEARLKAELLELRDTEGGLRSELEDARLDATSQRRRADLQQGREAEAAARLEQRCEQLQLECRAGRRRAAEAEAKLLQAESERDAVLRERADVSDRAARREEELQEELVAARAASAAVGAVGAAASAEAEGSPQLRGSAAEGAALEAEAEALRARVAELQGEASSLRLALAEGGPDRQLAARLREQHAQYEEELKTSRGVAKELSEVRAQLLKLEQDRTALGAALEARDRQLREAEDGARRAAAAQRDLDAFRAAAAAAVAEATGAEQGDGAGATEEAATAAVTPLQLGLVLARLQAEVTSSRRERTELQQDLDRAARRERGAQTELGKARTDLATAQARVDELQLDLRRARDEGATHKARVQVLREAITRAGTGGADAASGGAAAVTGAAGAGDAEELAAQLGVAQRRADALEALAKTRQQVLEQKSKELDALQAENARLSDAAAKAQQLEKVNAELWSSSRELEQQHGRLAAELERRERDADELDLGGGFDFDSRTTKVLHLIRGPDGQLATGSRSAVVLATSSTPSGPAAAVEEELKAVHEENAVLRQELSKGGASAAAAVAAGDMQRRQAEKQLDRFKKATRKYVQDFREGIYGILGWKVEMKGEGSAMRWHLASRYTNQRGRELVFQLRPGEPGRPAEFDLLATSWAEQLQEDRQAMAFLEVYGSVPGFLAAVTSDLVAQHGVPGG